VIAAIKRNAEADDRLFEKGKTMNKKAALVGVGVGAALMYFLDPDRGKRRRALVRDKVESAGNKASNYAEKMGRDIRNRAYGMVAETKALFRNEEVTDSVLEDRVRAKLGRSPVRIGAIGVAAREGVVTLTGPILADELPKVLAAARLVRGVKEVNNQLSVHHEGGNQPSLQGEPQPLGAVE
jgi:osmotically-inducible protein OsmY